MNSTSYVLFRTITEMFIATCMYTIKLPKKKCFALRIFLCLAVGFCGSLFMNRLIGSLWNEGANVFIAFFNSFKIVTFFWITMFSMMFCFKISFLNAAFFTVAGKATQDISVKLYYIIEKALFGIVPFWTLVIVYIGIYFAIYCVIYLILCRKLNGYDFNFLHKTEATLIIIGCVVNIFVGMYGDYFNGTKFEILVILSIQSIITDLFILSVLFQLFKTRMEESQKKQIELIRIQEEKQFEYNKEAMELINVKCHDLKHMLGHYEDKLSKEEIEELKSKINIYSASVKTGSKILDVVLAEKSLYAEKFSIPVTGIADGKILDFIRDGDVYSIMGNAFDNAIEACKEIENKEARFIFYNIRKIGDMCLIKVENSFIGEIKMNGEYPVSKKSDLNNHGFGVRSIAFTVKKYGGTFSIDAKDGIFRLNITIPVKKIKQFAIYD